LKFKAGDIGARLLESITRGLYDGNLNCIREYVQNSIDSHAKKIDIYFENGNENLVINDDAKGMTKNDLRLALRLGWSSKTEDDVGWRGIGIWSGVSVCKKMVIITKAKHHEKYIVEIDCNKLREEIDTNKDILDVLSSITSDIESEELGNDESLADDQYTIIRLEKILPQLRTVFDIKDIKKYLEDTVPAPFNENFSNGKKINEFLTKNHINLPQTEIFFQNEKIFRPPRKIISVFDDFVPKKFIVNNEEIAIAWFVTTNNSKEISDEIGGIIFKKKGFTIGDSALVLKQRKSFYNKWQVGEIHIVSKNIRENAPRNNFESADNLEDFLNEVGKFIDQLGAQNRYQSENLVTTFVDKAEKFAASGQIDAAEKEIKKAQSRLQNASHNFPEDPSLSPMKKQIDAKSKSEKQSLEKIITEIKTTKKIEKKSKEEIPTSKERFNLLKKGFLPELQTYERKFSSHGKLDFDISITRPIIDLLQQKTGLTSNEMKDLCMEAYGWSGINPSTKSPPRLTVDPQLNDKSTIPKELNYAKHRNMEFGVMIYAVHDLLVNSKKHKQGHPALAWFEKATDDEKYQMILEIYATIDLINRLIKKSERYQP